MTPDARGHTQHSVQASYIHHIELLLLPVRVVRELVLGLVTIDLVEDKEVGGHPLCPKSSVSLPVL